MKSSKIWAVIPTAFIALLFAFLAHARITTITWDPDPAWPAGTTIELEANGATESGITGTQYTLDVPVQPGEMINARARAVPPAGYQCGDPLGPCPPSDWTTLVQTLPAIPNGLLVTKERVISMAAERTGSGTSHGNNSVLSFSITIPSDANTVVVYVAGGGNSTTLINKLNFTGAAAVHFTLAAFGEYYVGAWRECEAWYITSASGDWPGTGTKTLYWDTQLKAEGISLYVQAYRNVDTSNPIVASKNKQGVVSSWTSAMSDPSANDLGIIATYRYNSTADVAPAGSGQTAVYEGSLYNSASISVGEELGEGQLTFTTGSEHVPCAFILRGTSGGGPQALAGTPAAVASATGAVQMALPVAAASASAATAVGSLSTALPLQAAASLIASAVGGVTLQLSMAGTALAEVLSSGALGMTIPLAADAAVETVASGDMPTGSEADLSGDAAVGGSATGALEQATGMVGAAAAEAVGAGTITLSMVLAGSAVVEALAVAGVTLESALAAQAAMEAAGSASAGMTTDLFGDAAAEVTGSAGARMTLPLAGDAAGEVAPTGDLTTLAEGALVGAATVVPTIVGALGLTTPIAGIANVLATAGGALGMNIPAAGDAAAVVLSTGNLQVSTGIPLSAAALAAASASGALSITIPMDAVALAQAVVTGALSGGTDTFTPNVGRTWTPGYAPRIWEPLASQRTWVAAANNRTWRR